MSDYIDFVAHADRLEQRIDQLNLTIAAQHVIIQERERRIAELEKEVSRLAASVMRGHGVKP